MQQIPFILITVLALICIYSVIKATANDKKKPYQHCLQFYALVHNEKTGGKQKELFTKTLYLGSKLTIMQLIHEGYFVTCINGFHYFIQDENNYIPIIKLLDISLEVFDTRNPFDTNLD